ncbi:hypothetical protein SLE2022_044420 [Rubroshorea leprosula]
MEEETTNGIFSKKSDHVFKELSGSDEVSSESWSLDSDFKDEVSVAYHGDGDAKSSRNSPSKRKVEDDDVDTAEATQVAETTVEHSIFRQNQGRQNSKNDIVSALNDSPANVDDSRESLHTIRTEKIQALCNNIHEGSTFEIEMLPASFDTENSK